MPPGCQGAAASLTSGLSSAAKRCASPLRKAKPTKKSAAADPIAKLKDRLVKGERLTEDELVQLELASVARWDELQAEEAAEEASRASRRGAAAAAVAPPPPPPPPPPKSASKAAAARAAAPLPIAPATTDPMAELRELRAAAQRERATLDSTAAELKRLRELRLAVARDPNAAIDLSTRRLEAERQQASATVEPLPPYEPHAASCAGSSADHAAAAERAAAVAVAAVNGIQAQLRAALAANHARVIDLFRQWDADGDGTVRKAELRKAIAMLGYEAPGAEVDKLFESFDRDGGGAIEYKELHRVIRRESEAEELNRSSLVTPVSTPQAGGLLPRGRGGTRSYASSDANSYYGESDEGRYERESPRVGEMALDAVEEEDEEDEEAVAALYSDVERGAPRRKESDAGLPSVPRSTTSEGTMALISSMAAAVGLSDLSGLSGHDAGGRAGAAGSAGPVEAGTGASAGKGKAAKGGGKQSAGASGKAKPVDPIALREAALRGVFALLERAAPWALWHARSSLDELPFALSPPTPSVGLDGRSILADDASSPPLPPSDSLLAELLSTAALTGGSFGVGLQMRWVAAGGVPAAWTPGVALALGLWPLHLISACAAALVLATALGGLVLRLTRCRREQRRGVSTDKLPLLPLHTASSTGAPPALVTGSSAGGGGGGEGRVIDWSTRCSLELFLAAYLACWCTPVAIEVWLARMRGAMASLSASDASASDAIAAADEPAMEASRLYRSRQDASRHRDAAASALGQPQPPSPSADLPDGMLVAQAIVVACAVLLLLAVAVRGLQMMLWRLWSPPCTLHPVPSVALAASSGSTSSSSSSCWDRCCCCWGPGATPAPPRAPPKPSPPPPTSTSKPSVSKGSSKGAASKGFLPLACQSCMGRATAALGWLRGLLTFGWLRALLASCRRATSKAASGKGSAGGKTPSKAGGGRAPPSRPPPKGGTVKKGTAAGKKQML